MHEVLLQHPIARQRTCPIDSNFRQNDMIHFISLLIDVGAPVLNKQLYLFCLVNALVQEETT